MSLGRAECCPPTAIDTRIPLRASCAAWVTWRDPVGYVTQLRALNAPLFPGSHQAVVYEGRTYSNVLRHACRALIEPPRLLSTEI
jgi:hypothetical protein